MSDSLLKVRDQVQINVPKSKLWEIISDFGNVSRWHPYITQSAITSSSNRGVGTERSSEGLQPGTLIEKVIGWDEGNSITYEMTVDPLAMSMLSISGDGDQTLVTSDFQVDPGTEEESQGLDRPGYVKQLQDMLKVLGLGLKMYAEHGQKLALPS